MDMVEWKMRQQVVEDVCRKLKLPIKDNCSNIQLCDMIFMLTGWESPYYGKRANFIDQYWRRYCQKSRAK